MISTAAYRIVQVVGWAALLGAHGVVLGTIISQAISGPSAGVWPSPALMHALVNSLVIASIATLLAVVIAAPVACAVAQARRRSARYALAGLMLVVILTMPSIHAYAWQLLLTSQAFLIRRLNDALVASGHWGARGMSGLVLGMYLWPIPAWAILDGLRRSGADAMELALLDARPARALWRGVFPLLRGPILSAAAVVFIAAVLDTVVAPLMLATDVWSVEMVREAELSLATARPAGELFWRSWPMVAAIALMALIALPGLRRIMAWHADAPTSRDVRRFGGRALTVSAGIVAIVTALLPVVVFFAMLSTDQRYTFGSALASVWRSARGPAGATAIVALTTAVLSLAIAIACELGLRGRDASSRFSGRLIVVMTVVGAVLPASLIATSLISFYASARLGNASGWNLYDDTPIVWTGALLARFALVPVCMTVLAGWTAPTTLVDQAETDGATKLTAWRVGRWPLVRGAALVGAGLVGLLAFSEVPASLLAKAPRWGDDSVAVYLDSQMHYGRHGQTLALALLMYIPVVAACLLLGLRGMWLERAARTGRRQRKAV